MKFIKLAVSKKEIMETAHDIAKAGVKKFGGDYIVAFGSALKYVYSVVNLRSMIKNRKNLREFGFDFLKATYENGSLVIENNNAFNCVETESDILKALNKLSSNILLNC